VQNRFEIGVMCTDIFYQARAMVILCFESTLLIVSSLTAYVVAIQLDKVRAFEIDESQDGQDGASSTRTRAMREQLMKEDTEKKYFESLVVLCS